MNSEKKHLIQSSISYYESNNKTIAAVPTVIEQSGRGEELLIFIQDYWGRE